MITVTYKNIEIYTGPWQDAPEAVRAYCQHLVDAGNDVAAYFQIKPAPLALAMQGYGVTVNEPS